ncbi:hypothetical protein [Sorangium sp. So ce1097]|uniref:hypothetical protein n=1 Tax=Sorangium sp. So ce1097 TaxID=3133330 RepID=UPI003F5F14BE
MLGALRDFVNVWSLMTSQNQERLLRTLVTSVRVEKETGVVEIELVNFGAGTRSQEQHGRPRPVNAAGPTYPHGHAVPAQQFARATHRGATAAKPEPVRWAAKVARTPALPHGLQGAIERGLITDRGAVARKLGLTRARVTQFVDLLLVAPDLQARVLGLEAVDGGEPRPSRRSGP